jgi:AcrR family transcriptional regulator
MAGRGKNAETRVRSPRGELVRIQAERDGQDSEARARMMEAMLEACGERGYRGVTVGDVIRRCGGYRTQFCRHFANKADCYADAYETEIERLNGTLLEAGCAQEGWQAGLCTALAGLASFAGERPTLARGLLVEVHVAGQRALAKREEVFERLSRAVDGARRENKSRHSAPPVTASFMLGVIESAVTTALLEGQPQQFASAVPELEQMVVAAYFGEQGADLPPGGTQGPER